jgi:hypothetical protein
MEWTAFTVSPTNVGNYNIRWFLTDGRPESKTFANMEDLLDFIEQNF